MFAGIEGTRPLLVEIQALVAPSSLATPRRAVVGWDTNRLAMVLAVLEARCGVAVGANDVYLNVAGGLRIGEPAADLAVAAAVVSSLADEPVPPDMVVFGEIGLGGEVRPVSQREARLREAAKLGFRSALVPRGRAGSGPTPRAPEGIAIDEIEHLADLVARFQPADRPLKRARREGPRIAGASRQRSVRGRWTSSGSPFSTSPSSPSPIFGALIGMSRGFAHAVLFIASWVAAGWVAWRYAKLIQPEVEQLVGSTELAYFLAMLAVFVAALIVLVMLTNALSRSVRSGPLGKPDRILGGASACCAPGWRSARPSCSTAIWAPANCRRRSRAAPPSR